MTLQSKITLGCVLALVAAAAYEIHRSHDASVVLQTQTAAIAVQQQAVNADQSVVNQTEKTQLAAIAAQKAAPPPTAAQVVKALPGILKLPQPVTIALTAPAQTSTPIDTNVPINAQTVPEPGLNVPSADIPAFRDYKLECDATAVKLNACTATVANDAKTAKLKDEQIADQQAALKGGTFWQRVRHDAKVIGIGVAIGAAAALAARH